MESFNLEMLEHTLDALDDAIYILNKNGDILYVNRANVEVWRESKETILSHNVFKLAAESRINFCILEEILRRKVPVSALQTFCDGDKKFRKHLVTQTPIFDANGDIAYSIGVIRDIDKLQAYYRNSQQFNTINVTGSPPETDIVCHDPISQELLHQINMIASSQATVLLTGETGVGKEVMAQYIHQNSVPNKEMISINCAALPETLLEAELFGYVKGAFTGALSNGKKGLIEAADGSTLLLDEINSMPLALQGKLLRVLETKTIRPIGSNKSKSVNFRLIATSNADLEQMVKDKQFRADLYYRLNVISFEVPPLRERCGDILPLCDVFLEKFNRAYNTNKYFSENMRKAILHHNWSGNVRELKNFVERAVLLTEPYVTMIERVPADFFMTEQTTPTSTRPTFTGEFVEGKSLRDHVNEYEQWLIEQAIQQEKTLTRAAFQLQLDKSTLVRKRNRKPDQQM